MIVYHGSTVEVSAPDVFHSHHSLDFGKGFYVTTVWEQAVRWAKRRADLFGTDLAIVNRYELKEFTPQIMVMRFDEDMGAWLDFVCRCRDGAPDYEKYDVIVGKVADDRVYRVVDMYKSGIWDKERALKEIKAYEGYDQMAFISQEALESSLRFIGSIEV